MVLTKQELAGALKKEVGILLHLAGKIDREHIDYRPTAKQRSSLELLRYLSVMGPALVATAKNGAFNRDAWVAEIAAADKRDFDETLKVIASQPEQYEQLLADMSDADFRAEMTGFDGSNLQGRLHRRTGARRLCRLSNAAVLLSQSVRTRRPRHGEPMEGCGRGASVTLASSRQCSS